jgi:haloacetate dehalogenase
VFDGFKLETVETDEVSIRLRRGGSGPPLLLLHGFPQTHAMWSKVAPRLAQHYTVVCPDLRGYGGSSKPESTPNHEPYSKRARARDQVEVMKKLGHEKFFVAGHDRGGRVAYRLALDSPGVVTKLAVLDIVPTGDTLRRADWRFGMGYWHWFFLAQPHPLPEKMISADPIAILFRNGQGYSDFEAYEDFLQNARDPKAIHAMCEDYRAAVSVDFQQDQADRGTRRIECPTLVMWGNRGVLPKWYDPVGIWKEWAGDVRGEEIESGHMLAEEAPDPTYQALRKFFGD